MPTKQRFNTIKHDTSFIVFLKSIQMKCGKTCALLDDVEPESRKHQYCQRSSSHCIWRSASNRMGYRVSKQSCPALDAKALLQFRTRNSSSRYISAPSPCMHSGIALRSSSLPKDCNRSWCWKPGKVFRWSQNFRIEALLWLPHISDLNCQVCRVPQTNKQMQTEICAN